MYSGGACTAVQCCSLRPAVRRASPPKQRETSDMDRTVRNNSYSTNGGSRPNHHVNNYNGKNRSSGGYNRISPTSETQGHHGCQQEELVNYIYESWDKVSREVERGGGGDVKYYQNTRIDPNFVPFNLEALWGRRPVQTIKRQQHNS